jgi:hypothetical protein
MLDVAIEKNPTGTKLQFRSRIFVTQVMALASPLKLYFAGRSEREALCGGFFCLELHIIPSGRNVL